LQEVDRDQPRSGTADLTAVAAAAGGFVAHHFEPALTGLPGGWRRAARDEPSGTPQYGVALLSRHPVTAWRSVSLPALPGRVPVLFPGRRRPVLVGDEPRVAVVADVQAPGGPVTVVCTHLSFIPWWNLVQLRRLLAAVAGADPLVLMGDLNALPPRVRRVTGMTALATALTYPAHEPHEQLDHILVRGALRPASAAVADEMPVSDHRPLVVVVEPARH
jgi:endonuclease/exonuclease/phosphatase family metal-dependent hydrolase